MKIENFVTSFHSRFKLPLSIWYSCVIQDFDEQFMHNLQDILLTSICAFKLCCFEVKTAKNTRENVKMNVLAIVGVNHTMG